MSPGVKLVRDIYTYFKKFDYNTIVMGASIRKIETVKALSGCDNLTMPTSVLELLSNV